MKVDASIFKAYDIRGVVDRTLREDAVRAVGRVLGTMAHDAGVKRFCFDRDGRLTGEQLQNALVEGIASTGMDVLDVGSVSTPVLYYATNHFNCSTGVAVTGSHNPPEYNGLKMMATGVTLFADQIQCICERIEREGWCVAEKSGRIEHDVEVVPLYGDVDGHFPNHHPAPSKPENLEALIDKVKEVGADYGFALDGDADRLGVVTNAGAVIYPDRLMRLFAEDILCKHLGAQIVYDVKCSRKLVDWVRAKGGEPVISPTGHSLVKAKLRKAAAPFAGEGRATSSSTTNAGRASTTVCTRQCVSLRFSREANHYRPFFKNFLTPSIRRKSRFRRKKTGTRRSSPRSRRNVVFPMRTPSSRLTGFVSSGRTGMRLQYDARSGRTFRRRHEGIARAHLAVLHGRDASRRLCFKDPITER